MTKKMLEEQLRGLPKSYDRNKGYSLEKSGNGWHITQNNVVIMNVVKDGGSYLYSFPDDDSYLFGSETEPAVSFGHVIDMVNNKLIMLEEMVSPDNEPPYSREDLARSTAILKYDNLHREYKAIKESIKGTEHVDFSKCATIKPLTKNGGVESYTIEIDGHVVFLVNRYGSRSVIYIGHREIATGGCDINRLVLDTKRLFKARHLALRAARAELMRLHKIIT